MSQRPPAPPWSLRQLPGARYLKPALERLRALSARPAAWVHRLRLPTRPAGSPHAAPPAAGSGTNESLSAMIRTLSEQQRRIDRVERRLETLGQRLDALEPNPAHASGPLTPAGREHLDRILDALGCPHGPARSDLWSGEPTPLVLALRLAQQPPLATAPPKALGRLQDWLNQLPGEPLTLIAPRAGQRCDERLHEVNPVSNERVPFEHIVRIDRLGLLAGGRVQIKARVDVRR